MISKRYLKLTTVPVSSLLLSSLAYAGDNTAAEGLITKITNMLQNGCGLMWVMLLSSVIGLTYAIERIISLRLKNYIKPTFSEAVNSRLESSSLEETAAYLLEEDSLIARTYRGIITRSLGSREEMERGIDDDLSRALWDERKNIKPIGLVASIAPLLGLLGTVIGMIDAFKQASENGMNDPTIFAGGIYQALYTTAFGLVLAIPFFILYNYLKTKSELIMRKVEDESLLFVDKVITEKSKSEDIEQPKAA